ncbi:hypothetical protein [Zobellia roscoffensis]|uniref:hypothetical protein n=1 Tax=Zobellia roscoffensis TaxID=2779508 RepID=UPI00188CD4CD|nr:hypothetical protein [Zobellia roscoffensis]
MQVPRTAKIIFRILSVFLVLMALIVLGAQLMAKKSIANYLDTKLPPHIQLDYKDVDVNVLNGTAILEAIDLKIGVQDSIHQSAVAKIGAIEIIGLGYWHFLFNNKISVKNLNVERPVLIHYSKENNSDSSNTKNNHIALLKMIHIDRINVIDGKVTLLKNKKDSLVMQLDSVNVEIDDVTTNAEIINSKIPVKYGSFEFGSTSFYANLGPYEEINVAKIRVEEGNLSITDLQLKSKYNKTKLSWHLPKEHDYIDLKIPELSFKSIAFGYDKDQFWVGTGSGELNEPNLEIYRDKLLPDDTDRKKLYSEAIRKLPIQLDIPEIKINKGFIAYSERVNRETTPGEIIFGEVNAKIFHIQNVPEKKEKTRVEAKALLMNDAPITLNWSFDAKDKSDAFVASGTVKGFDSKHINPFLESNLRVRAKGEIQELYFTISGDAFSSSGDMKMKYEDFKFSILKKDRLRINKLLTVIGSIFVNDGSKTDENGYRYGGIKAERNPTKSFFNYLWINVSDGLTSTIIGNGKNEKRKK